MYVYFLKYYLLQYYDNKTQDNTYKRLHFVPIFKMKIAEIKMIKDNWVGDIQIY
jgi:hypothetical protein